MKEKTEWQERLARTGLNQTEFGLLLGRDRVTAYRMLTGKPRIKGVPHVTKAIILALELMAEKDPKLIQLWLKRSIAEQAAENASQEQDAT